MASTTLHAGGGLPSSDDDLRTALRQQQPETVPESSILRANAAGHHNPSYSGDLPKTLRSPPDIVDRLDEIREILSAAAQTLGVQLPQPSLFTTDFESLKPTDSAYDMKKVIDYQVSLKCSSGKKRRSYESRRIHTGFELTQLRYPESMNTSVELR